MKKILTPIKAIRAKCVDCMNHQTKEIRLCPMKDCPLWPYRMGKRPKRTVDDVPPEAGEKSQKRQ